MNKKYKKKNKVIKIRNTKSPFTKIKWSNYANIYIFLNSILYKKLNNNVVFTKHPYLKNNIFYTIKNTFLSNINKNDKHFYKDYLKLAFHIKKNNINFKYKMYSIKY